MIAYVDESDGLRYRVRTAASLFLFFVAEGIKLPISGSLGWAKGAVKRHSWTSDGDVTIMVSIVSSVFLLVLLGFRDGWPIEQAEKMILRPPRFCFRRHRQGAMCYGLWAWAWLLLRSPLFEDRVLSLRSWSTERPRIPPDFTGWVYPP